MIENIIWLALGLLVIASVIPQGNKLKLTIAGAGWLFFSVHWALQWQHYFGLGDYTNVVLTVLASAFSVIIGVVLIRQDKSLLGNNNGISTMTSISMASTAAAIGGLSYFVFSEIPSMNEWLISTVANQTIWLASVFGIMVTRLDWNLLAVNGYRVEIILACTAIESIALFIGIIASVRAPFKRLTLAFLVSVPVIYGLNLLRNVFVVDAYGMTWFGDPETSFYVAHTLIAKIGSLIALFIIAYAVLKILPEIIDMIDGILNLVRGIFKHAG
ncbi:MAG: archaeosortase A [Candidatus Methanoperedens sp.]|nr:archaeosortase A [Candidatus Methanoperedens sp.]MCZ7394685.1 archaeosortase A [Candidatus Methanoperedens sp.]